IPVDGAVVGATYDWFQQLVAFGTDAYIYDEDGLRTQTTIGGTTRNYVYDVNGYQAPWQQMASSTMYVAGAAISRLMIGGSAQLPMIDSQAGVTPLNRALDRVLEIRDDAGTVLQRFVYGLGLI